jgi:hypothetical protein
MERTKKYNADQIADYNTPLFNQIEIKLNPTQFPIAYYAKVDEMVKSGMQKEDAELLLKTNPILLDVYYSTEKDNEGLYCVESEIVECATIFNPYSGIEMEDFDDDVHTELYSLRREVEKQLLHKRENFDAINVILKNIFECDIIYGTDYEPLDNEDNRIDFALKDKNIIGSIWYLNTNDKICDMYITEISLDLG